ncbi:MAG: hypothetical protein KGN00_09110 [Chloroflexota bacterium]|nr:hypothetical protein [Chloroflexota bacterium]MDE3193830.1 hypothetical protein [Chloroflexota bacterium]
MASERAIPQPCHFEEARNGWGAMPLQYKDGLAFKLVGVWERWDACWYAKTATYGYTTDGGTAFFPLFSMLERVVALFGPHVVVAGMLLNVVVATAALWGLYRIVVRDVDAATARRAMLLLAIFPGALFLLAPFSEAVCLACAVWAIERARAGSWGAALVLAFLEGLSRPVGGLVALPLAWLAWRQRPPGRRAALAAAAVVAAPASGLLYLAYTVRVVGRSMFDASAAWGTESFHAPWEVFAATVAWIRRTGDPLQALDLTLLVVFLVLVVVGIRRLPADLTLYAVPQLYLAWSRLLPTPLTSTPRYLLVIFPAFIVLALLLRERRAHWAYAILSLLLLGALANEFVVGDFVG